MIYSDVIIVGGGPAGSTCARELNQTGVEVLILDKHSFPRDKLCAGWITPKVVEDLQLDESSYPHSIVTFNKIFVHIFGITFKLKTLQHSIRRYELDNWLLKRSGVDVLRHRVVSARKHKDYYIVDDKFKCKFLVGAGGTYCPINKEYFENINRHVKRLQLATIEMEFKFDYADNNCHLWFFKDGLPGYSWYVPKGNGYLNIGIGAMSLGLKRRGKNIKECWNGFIQELKSRSLIDNRDLKPKGYNYYVTISGRDSMKCHVDNAFIVGDSAALSTRDLGEGIGPAIESGRLAAKAIINKTQYSPQSVTRYSLPAALFSWFPRVYSDRVIGYMLDKLEVPDRVVKYIFT